MVTLPVYPWEELTPYRQRAEQHPDGVCDLSIGSPVDPVPDFIQQALVQASNWPGYPVAGGDNHLRRAIAEWYARRRNVPELGPEHTAATVGSKELVAWLPLMLGLGPGDVVVRPRISYPTYDIGARLAGAVSIPTDDLATVDAETAARVKLVWLNSPANPTGDVLDRDQLSRTVDHARQLGAVIANDECYAELGWDHWEDHRVPSILDPGVTQGDLRGVLSVYSLSKQSNMAGYRAAFMAGDPTLIAELINIRKHAGMLVPGPLQAAMVAALNDDEHVAVQKARYRTRRGQLMSALRQAGLEVHGSEAGLYLWVCQPGRRPDSATPQDSWDLVRRFADAGIVTGPGVFYSEAGNGYVRLSITAPDDVVAVAAHRISAGL
ncbi:succinyldiaminopimelate transaminase [Auritidibacter ignavus]|uniref:succinyldiaminopimelate transaminase n=1 Tax=Auritidibacter ignavus TaxID=678932 RepID=UPI00109D73D0|nr:succinyldiaminopimelate transaminase [Auritidibacter ignavus]